MNSTNSVKGLGIDIVQINRIEKLYKKFHERFIERILSPNEIQKFESHAFKIKFLAKRFAAKEAFAKATGLGFSQGISFKEIEIANDAQGKPQIILHEKTKELLTYRNIQQIELSISDEKEYVVAVVMIL